MQERVHQVRGRFSVESKPGAGTRVIAAVPIVAAGGEAFSSALMDHGGRAQGAA
jgi:signal transduction histidine kinase